MLNRCTPLVSVLIPLYNHEHYVEHCLNSVCADGWENLELVIHDDCSSDRSWAVVKRWCAQNSQFFTNIILEQSTSNRGVVGSLNRLLELATGDFLVSPLASDDALLPGGIEARLNALNLRPDWLAVFGDAEPINDEGKKLHESYLFDYFHSRKTHLLVDSKRRMEMIVRWSVPGPVILYRREAFDTEQGVGKYNPAMCIEDRDMYLRLLENHQLGFIDRTVAQYRLHSNNTMRNPAIRIKSMLDRAKPLLDVSNSGHLDNWERFVADRTGNALLAHAHRRSTANSIGRLGYSLKRISYTIQARLVATVYFWSR